MASPATAIIANPASANGRTAREWPQIEARAVALGLTPHVFLTERRGHATELARTALESGAQLVVVVGGDGTVCDVVNGFMQADPAHRDTAHLAIVSRGSGCDLARMFKLPRDTDAALSVAVHGCSRTLDVAWAADAAHVRHYLNIATVGLSAEVAERADRSRKRLGARAAYAWAAFAAFRGYRNSLQHVEVDDHSIELVGSDVIVGNCRYLAGGMKALPNADPSDALLDVLIWGDATTTDFVRTLPSLYRGTHLNHPKATFLRGRRVTVTSPAELRVEVDGEPFGCTPVQFSVEPAALRLRTPPAPGCRDAPSGITLRSTQLPTT